jgi:hypothetical protein
LPVTPLIESAMGPIVGVLDHGPTTVKFDHPAAIDRPQQAGDAEVGKGLRRMAAEAPRFS